MIKRILSPIFFASFILPITVVTIGALVGTETIRNFPSGDFFNLILFSGILSTPVFTLMSDFLMRFEQNNRPQLLDHLRQSALCYIAGGISLMYLLKNGIYGGIPEVFHLSILSISAWAIIVNLGFIYVKQARRGVRR